MESLPYGTGEITVRIPGKNYLKTLIPPYRPGVEDETGEILSALQHPIGTPPLREMAKRKRGTMWNSGWGHPYSGSHGNPQGQHTR
jgi:hypothetical protein